MDWCELVCITSFSPGYKWVITFNSARNSWYKTSISGPEYQKKYITPLFRVGGLSTKFNINFIRHLKHIISIWHLKLLRRSYLLVAKQTYIRICPVRANLYSRHFKRSPNYPTQHHNKNLLVLLTPSSIMCFLIR